MSVPGEYLCESLVAYIVLVEIFWYIHTNTNNHYTHITI